jgi:hypothetical protein
MTLETFLSIASLAVSIGGLVPVFRLQDREKAVVLAIMITVLVLLSAVGLYRAVQHQAEIRYVSGEVTKALGKGPSTINQLEQSLHHVAFAHLLEAVDNLVRSGKIQYEPTKLYDAQQNVYSVGVYFVPTLR